MKLIHILYGCYFSSTYRRDRDQDKMGESSSTSHPTVTATACVALWTALHHSESARAVARKYDRAEGAGVGVTGGMRLGLTQMLRHASHDMPNASRERELVLRGREYGTSNSTSTTANNYSDTNNNFIVSTVSTARSALVHLMESS